MDTLLNLLALLSIGLGMGLAIITLWRIARKLFSTKSKSEPDDVIITALLSALAAHFVFHINGPIVHHLIIAIGAIIASVVFLKITKTIFRKKTGY